VVGRRGLRTRGWVPSSVPGGPGAPPRPGARAAEGVTRAPPPCPLSLARVSGEAPPRGARGARSLGPAAGGALCGSRGSESHLLAAERRGRGRRRRGGGGKKRRGANPLLPPAPTSRGLRSPRLSACTSPLAPGPARPSLPATPRQPLLQPLSPTRCGPARPGRHSHPASLRRAQARGAASMCPGAASAPQTR
jgi:hypothetical protein